jgi:hypothetical protein
MSPWQQFVAVELRPLHWWRSRKQISKGPITGVNFTWFPRKNYNKSGRRGGGINKEKEKECNNIVQTKKNTSD